MLENTTGTELRQDHSAAVRNDLHDDAMKTFVKSSSNTTATKAVDANQKPPQKVETANEKRMSDESKFFRDLYEKQNVELDPITKGQGALQCLEQMQKEGRLSISQDQLKVEAQRIQAREANESVLNLGEHEKLWSEKEIDQLVKADVARPKGIDVSNWQSSIDWKQVKDAGYQFAFMKATEGTEFIDHTFDQFRKEARDAGVKVGYYHYFHPEDPVDQQVKLFCDVVGKAEPDSLRLMIDAEDPAMWKNYTQQQRAQMVEQFLQGVQDRLGVTPQACIYCSRDFADNMLGNAPELKKYSLFIADWGPHDPRVPSPWDKWDFWQYTDAGNVPGIKDKVDLDMYNGTDINEQHK